MSKLQKLLVIAFEYVHFIWIYVETDQQIKRFTLAIGQNINDKNIQGHRTRFETFHTNNFS